MEASICPTEKQSREYNDKEVILVQWNGRKEEQQLERRKNTDRVSV